MAIYKYQAKGPSGDIDKGTRDAQNAEAVEKWIRRRGYEPVKVSRDWTQIEITEAKVKNIEIVVFTRQLAAMVAAGLPLTRALTVMVEQVKVAPLRSAIQDMLSEVTQGETLADAMRPHDKFFTPLYVNMVAAGEASSDLDVVLERLATYMEEADDLQRRVKGAMVYPVSVLAIAYIAVLVLLYFVIPNFEEMFSSLEELPFITEVNLKLSHIVRGNLMWVLAGTGGFLYGLKKAFSTPPVRKVIDRWGIKIPVVGPIILKTATARFARTLATLLDNGVKLPEALKLTSETAGNLVIKQAIDEARVAVMQGHEMTGPLKQSGVFEPMVIQLVRVGEETGSIETMLDKVADFFEADVRRTVEGALKMIEPLMMAFIGIVIGGILMSVYLPLFDSMLSMGQ